VTDWAQYQHGDWPDFDMDAWREKMVALTKALEHGTVYSYHVIIDEPYHRSRYGHAP
jgi:hypothetical protein